MTVNLSQLPEEDEINAVIFGEIVKRLSAGMTDLRLTMTTNNADDNRDTAHLQLIRGIISCLLILFE